MTLSSYSLIFRSVTIQRLINVVPLVTHLRLIVAREKAYPIVADFSKIGGSGSVQRGNENNIPFGPESRIH